MKNIFKNFLLWFFTSVIILTLIYSVRNDTDKFKPLLNIKPFFIIQLMLICASLFIPSALIRKVMAQRLGYKFSFIDWYGLTMVSNLVNLIVPLRGDYIFSAVYLKKRFGLSITQFGSILYGSIILLAFTLSIEGYLSLFLLGIIKRIWYWEMWLIITGLLISTLFFAFFPKKFITGDSWYLKKVRIFLEEWEILRSDHNLLMLVTGLIVINSIIFIFWIYFSYFALGYKIEFLSLVLLGVVIQISFFVGITPGNIGIREVVTGFISKIIGLGFVEGVAVTVLQRVISTLVFLIIGGIFSFLITHSLVNNNKK